MLVVLSLALFGARSRSRQGGGGAPCAAYGAGLIVAGTAALVAGGLAGDAVVGGLAPTEATAPAVRDVWDISTTLLAQAAVATIGYGLVMILGAWLAGPPSWATTARRTVAPYLRDPALAWGAFGALAAVVVLWWSPTPATRNPVTAVILLRAAGPRLRRAPPPDRRRVRRRTRPAAARGRALTSGTSYFRRLILNRLTAAVASRLPAPSRALTRNTCLPGASFR